MAGFDPDAFLAEGGGTAVAEFDPDKFLAEPAAKAAPAFDPDAFLAEPAAPKSIASQAYQGMQDIGRGFVRGMGGVISSVGGAVAMAPDIGMGAPGSQLVKPVGDIYRTAGDWITSAGKKLSDVPGAAKTGTFEPGNPTWWAEKLPEVAPQLAAQLGLAVATRGGTLAFAAAGGAQMAGSTYNEAKQERLAKGEDDETASKGAASEAAIVGSIGAALEAIPGAEYLTKGPIGQMVGKVLRNKVVAKAAVGGVTEPVTEIVQELVAIGAASVARNKEFTTEEIGQRVGSAGLLGLAAGTAAGGAMANLEAHTNELTGAVEQDVAALGLTPEEQSVPEVVDTRLDKTNEFLRQTPSEQVAPTTEPLPTDTESVEAPPEPQTQPDPNQPPPVPPKEAPPAAPADPNDYVVQLKIGDELVEGGPDDNHKSLFERHTKDMDKSSPEYEAAVLAFADDSAHVFKNTKDPSGKALSRDELATALGESKPVQSERLRVLKAEWAGRKAAAETTAETSPAPETQPATAQPPPVPPKEAPPAAPAAPSDQSPTGIRNAKVDQERVERGLPERMAPLRRSFGKLWDEAMTRVDKDAQAGPKLVAEIAENPRPLEDWESALLAHEQVTRQNAFDKAVADVNANPGNAEAAAALTTVRNEVQEIYDAGQKAGTKSGQSLAARKLLVNDDYTLAKMEAVTRAVVNDGKPLSQQQAAEVAALHKRIAETEKKLAEYESKETERASQDAFANLLKELKSEAKAEAKSGKTLTDFLDTQADKARARIRKRSGALNIGINPAELADHVIIGSSWIAKGITKLADFTARMVKEFGEAIRPHLPDIFSKAKDYHAANASLFGRSTKPQKSAVEAAKANAAAGKPLSEGVVFDLAREKVRGGAVGLDAVMKAVHAELEPLHPGLTEREVRDAFSGYGKTKLPSKEADLVALRELRRLGQLVSAIEDAQSKQAPKKSGMQRDDPTQAVREKVKELHEAMKANGIETTSPEQQLKSSNAARATALRNQIADLDKQLATGTKPTKGSPAPDTPEVETLRAERDSMKEKLAEIEAEANPPRSPDEIRLESDKKAIATRTRKLQEKIAANDYTRPVKKDPLMDDAKVSLMFENKKAKEDYARGLFEADLAKRNTAQKILGGVSEVISTSKAVMTSVDLSAVGRQGGFIAFGNPIRAARAIPDMIRALVSEKAQFRAMEQIKQRENSRSGLYDRAKLFLSDDTSVNLKKLEEQFNTRWLQSSEMKPGQPVRNVLRKAKNIAAAPVAGSGRAFNTFLNRLRADTFDAMVASLAKGAKPTIEEAKAVANFVNVATGRGTIQSGPVLGSVFFAPKLVASRFQLIGGQPFYKGTNRTRVLVAKEYGKFLTGIAAMYALAAAFSDKDDKEPVIEFDPRSSDFGKIRIGNTRIDPLVGLAQTSVLLTRVLKGEKKTIKGAIVPLTGPKAVRDTTTTVLMRFARTKFSPLVGAIVSGREKRNVIGDPTTWTKEALGLAMPLSLRDVYDVMKEHGVPTGTALTVVSLFGFGMQNYSERKPAKAADGT